MSDPIRSSPRPMTVLVANDQEWTARSLETILSADGYSVVRAFTAAQTREKAAATRPDAFVLDVQLPDLDGMSLCQSLRQDPLIGPAVPMLLTTAGPSGRQERIAAYRAGAWEFFGQPFDGETLLLRLQVYLGAKAVVDDLRAESLLDDATGLYSRRGLLRRGRELVADAARRHGRLACVVLRPEVPELDASLTAAEGLARGIGQFLRSSGRTADVVGRVGPLEFCVMTAGAGDDDVRGLIRRLNDGAAESPLRDLLGSSRFAFRAAFCSLAEDDAGQADLEMVLDRATATVLGMAGESLIATVPG